MPEKESEWWLQLFPSFRSIFDALPPGKTNSEVNYIINKLDLAPGRKFLDCPCGIGRISIPLARRGIRVTGVDITKSYLDELSNKASRMNLRIAIEHNDMRRINFDSQFDAAGNLWTSFGYFSREADNYRVLKKMFQALKPGGKFMLHVINRDWIIRNYTSSSWFEAGGARVFEYRRMDLSRSVNESVWHCVKDGKETVVRMGLRMYSYHEIIQMMQRVGFVEIKGYGSTRNEPVSFNRMMMFVVGTRPK
jgi:ubiquinone/menaquinone biosynthesis C-methylase UbiE